MHIFLKKVTISEQYYNSNTIDFSKSGLTKDAKGMISASVWNLGGSDSNSKLAREFYTLERGSIVYSGRLTKWTGEVGLMYVSGCKNNNWLFNSKYGQ